MSDSDAAPSHRPAVSARPAAPERRSSVVRLPSQPIVAPQECACCGAAPTEQRAMSDGAGRELLVGYCELCAQHVARESTRRLASGLSSALLGVALALALPIAFPWLSVGACAALSFSGAVLPLLPALVFGRAPAGHARASAAAEFAGPSELVCHRPEFARAFAAVPGVELAREPGRRRRVPVLLLPGLVSGLVLAPLLHVYQHPQLRVVNASDRTLEILLDGETVGFVEPVAAESPAAGLSTRVPAGERALLARDSSGQVLAESRVNVLPGRAHLYAPAAPDVCFWLESTHYGRAGSRSEHAPLEGTDRFWVIPEHVSGWFVPSAPPEDGARTTGGTTTVLRQGACSEPPVRP